MLASLAIVATGPFSLSASGALIRLGPSPYLSAADSPLLANPALTTVLEDFEDGALNVHGIVNEPIQDVNVPPGCQRAWIRPGAWPGHAFC